MTWETTPVEVGDGMQLAVIRRGEGPDVVMIHGFPELAYSWRHQLPVIADHGYRAIAYDLRGFGGSSAPEGIEPYALRHHVADLIGLLDRLDIGRAVLVGHDWGSVIAMTTTLRHPDRVQGLVSLNVPYRGWCAAFPRIEDIRDRLADRFGYVLFFQEPGRAEAWFAEDPAGRLRAFYDDAAVQPFLDDDDFQVYLDAFTTTGISGPLALYRNIDANWEWTRDLANAPITVPMAMIAAERDPVLPATLIEGMERWVPDLERTVVTGSGHWTQQEQPDQVNTAILRFLARVAPTQG